MLVVSLQKLEYRSWIITTEVDVLHTIAEANSFCHTPAKVLVLNWQSLCLVKKHQIE